MPAYNSCQLIGNLTRDPESRTFNNGENKVVNFGIAVNRRWTDGQGNQKEDVLFMDCSAWNRTGDLIEEHLSKGDPAMVVGRLETQKWTDKDTNQERSKTALVVERVVFLGTREDGEESSNKSSGGAGTGRGTETEDRKTPF